MTSLHTAARPQRTPCSVPLVAEVPLRLPFWRYWALFQGRPYSFLLDSAMDPERLGQYSFLGGDPFLVYRARRETASTSPLGAARVEVLDLRRGNGGGVPSPASTRQVPDLFQDLRQTLAPFLVDPQLFRSSPFLPFYGGAVGYFGYDAKHFVEELPEVALDDLQLPDVYLMLFDAILAYCHGSGRAYLSVLGRGEDPGEALRNAEGLASDLRNRIAQFESSPPPEWTGPPAEATLDAPTGLRSFFDAASYADLIRRVKEHILAGDVYELCLTHRLDAPFDGDPWDLYQELRRINPAPFAGYLHFPGLQVVSSSPERFLCLGRDRVAESRPIKGTRPRGSSPTEDEAIAKELATCIKDRAENMMIVDLVRNDFGRVCKFHTVSVPELMMVERYATVFQLVSTIQGELEEEYDALDLIRACFPGGSMTGAPKIEAMKMIERLEPVKRGIYSGSMGYLDFTGSLDLNMVIRTFVVKDRRCYFGVGGAVVADSDPMEEYLESMAKARALITSLDNLARIGACHGARA